MVHSFDNSASTSSLRQHRVATSDLDGTCPHFDVLFSYNERLDHLSRMHMAGGPHAQGRAQQRHADRVARANVTIRCRRTCTPARVCRPAVTSHACRSEQQHGATDGQGSQLSDGGERLRSLGRQLLAGACSLAIIAAPPAPAEEVRAASCPRDFHSIHLVARLRRVRLTTLLISSNWSLKDAWNVTSSDRDQGPLFPGPAPPPATLPAP
jgi:hypothetical protein